MFALRCAQRLPKSVRVEWEDGLSANFTYVWLRDNSTQRPSLLHLDLNSCPQQVEYSRQRLNVVWPPFISSEYSSKFLRHHSTAKLTKRWEDASSVPVLSIPWTVIPCSGRREAFEHMGTDEWRDSAHELGTVWCHLRKVPSVYSVQSLNGSSRVNLVNVTLAIDALQAINPECFAFLTSNFIEYREGPFQARHRLLKVQDGNLVSLIFNNETRSSEITVESLDMLYESLKKLNQICCNLAQTVQIDPGQRLVVDNSQALIGAPPQTGRRLLFRIYS